ncbi:MAG: hypothetical protein PHV30_04345 [Candidatus Margulisbacteria bacterium]|nr:hypothetical protein [Candidatus Margulisiibacteriota bacterium]
MLQVTDNAKTEFARILLENKAEKDVAIRLIFNDKTRKLELVLSKVLEHDHIEKSAEGKIVLLIDSGLFPQLEAYIVDFDKTTGITVNKV